MMMMPPACKLPCIEFKLNIFLDFTPILHGVDVTGVVGYSLTLSQTKEKNDTKFHHFYSKETKRNFNFGNG